MSLEAEDQHSRIALQTCPGLDVEIVRADPLLDRSAANHATSCNGATTTRTLRLFGLFAGVAFALAIIGLYGVMTYSVTQRRRELGIRMALSATTKDVLQLTVGHGMRLATLGIALGVIGALAASRLLTTLLFRVSAVDALTFVGAALSLLLVALVACLIPARRATKVDPLTALRSE